MKIEAQRLRNLTTGILHTDINCIHEDLELITGEEGLMTHMLPDVCKAVTPWLKAHVACDRFWTKELDTEHKGGVELPDPTPEDRKEMLEVFNELPNPLAGKAVIPVVID